MEGWDRQTDIAIHWLNYTLYNQSSIFSYVRQFEFAILELRNLVKEVLISLASTMTGKLSVNAIPPVTVRNILKNVTSYLPAGYTEPYTRGSARSPSPCESEPCYFFVLSFTFSWPSSADWLPWVGGEGWGRFVCVFLEGKLCPDRDLPACTLGKRLWSRSGLSASHQERGLAASPEEPDSPSRCSRVRGLCSVGHMSLETGFLVWLFLNSYF